MRPLVLWQPLVSHGEEHAEPTDFVPANVWLLGVYIEILADIAGTVVNLDVGDGTDVDRWGAGLGITAGTRSSTADFTAADAFGVFLLAAEDVVIRDDGVLLMTGGQFRVGAVYRWISAQWCLVDERVGWLI